MWVLPRLSILDLIAGSLPNMRNRTYDHHHLIYHLWFDHNSSFMYHTQTWRHLWDPWRNQRHLTWPKLFHFTLVTKTLFRRIRRVCKNKIILKTNQKLNTYIMYIWYKLGNQVWNEIVKYPKMDSDIQGTIPWEGFTTNSDPVVISWW